MEFTWHYVKDGKPKRKGNYLAATEGNKKAILCEYENGKFYAFAYEGENGNKLELAPYAWADMPDKPTRG